MDFAHFLAAQTATFATAMAELRAGQKRSHWIWFVFPILAGLRESATAVRFALPDAAAAREYLEHPLLGARLREAVAVVHEQVCSRGIALERLMGGDIDAGKLVSSLTLFAAVALDATLVAHAQELLAAAEAQDIPRCEFTERALAP